MADSSCYCSFPAGALVSVRATDALAWRDGVSQGLTPNGQCYVVDLGAPLPTGDEWSGVTRRYGGGDLVSQVCIHTQVDFLVPAQLIKAR